MKSSLKNESFARVDLKKEKPGCKVYRICNLCSECFHPNSRFERYCQECKKDNEAFKYGGWLPEVDDRLVSLNF